MSAGQKISRRTWGASLFLHAVILSLLVFHFSFFSSSQLVIEQGKDADQQVIEAMVVQEQVPVKKPAPIAPPVPATPKPVAAPSPLALKKQLLSDLKKDISRQKHQQTLVQQQKILNALAQQKQLLQEKIRADGVRSARTRGIVDRYRALILQVISQNWRLPGVPDKNQSAELLIRLAPGGIVLDVQVTRSSGNPGLDGSARSAVMRSSPLPVPSDPASFEAFRSFVLKVRPENILADNA